MSFAEGDIVVRGIARREGDPPGYLVEAEFDLKQAEEKLAWATEAMTKTFGINYCRILADVEHKKEALTAARARVEQETSKKAAVIARSKRPASPTPISKGVRKWKRFHE